ncbi:MAG: metal ABC transporter ATP-binding protein [Candidatus Nanopelagicales bacterium]|nr:metal ABC transporter ATP-binding protein [Candidatus Nanopelagicales bacterium]
MPNSTDAVVGSNVIITRGGRVAVAASDFTIPQGCITAIIGPNGSGKSTILHAIAGLLPVSSGSLSVLGATPELSQSRISYVLQYTTVPTGTPLTVAEAVAMGRYPALGFLRRPSRSDKEKVSSAMSRLEISDLAKRHLTELSGGQRQRVYVAQGIAQDHSMLLLDEPLTGLDINSAKTIDSIIHDEPTRGCSVILTTHDLEEARAADHVILMSGKVVSYGPPDTVLTAENLTSAYGLGALHDRDSDAPLFPTEHHHDHDSH